MNGVKVYRTDEEGTIIATSDGNKITLNTKSKKFHKPSCNSLPEENNREDSTQSRETIVEQGYEPCKRCNP